MNINDIEIGLRIFAACSVIIGVIISVSTFNKNVKLKRAEWLKSLFEMFYIQTPFKEVRKWIDFDMIETELKSDGNHIKEELFTDYLNFFEFIATLKIEKQLSLTEINHLFYYYLNTIKKSELCMAYIRQHGFKHLEDLLNEIT